MEFVILFCSFISTTIVSVCIDKYGKVKATLKLAKKGYKVPREELYKFFSKTRANNILSKVALIVPGLNIVSALISSYHNNKNILSDKHICDALVSLDEEDIYEFKRTNNIFDEYIYTEGLDASGIIQEEKKEVVLNLKNDAFDSKYTIEEIMQICKDLNISCSVGYADDANVAILGISGIDKIDKVMFYNGKCANFEPALLEEGMEFNLYAYNPIIAMNPVVNKELELIKKQRGVSNKGKESKQTIEEKMTLKKKVR